MFGPVEIDVPRDRDATFEPKIVAKRQRRLSGVDELVISLSARGLTTGEVAAHLAEVYGAEVSRQTISTIIDKVVEGMAEWQNRPLDPVGFHNLAMAADQRFQAAVSYSLMSPPRMGRRRILGMNLFGDR